MLLLLPHRVPMLAIRKMIINIVFQIDSSQREIDCRGSGHMQIDPRVKSNVCMCVPYAVSCGARHILPVDVHWTHRKCASQS